MLESYFNKNVRYIRSLKNMTQKELADQLNVDRSTISKWEKGTISATIGNALEVSKVLNVPIELLLSKDLSKYSTDEINAILKKYSKEFDNLISNTFRNNR